MLNAALSKAKMFTFTVLFHTHSSAAVIIRGFIWKVSILENASKYIFSWFSILVVKTTCPTFYPKLLAVVRAEIFGDVVGDSALLWAVLVSCHSSDERATERDCDIFCNKPEGKLGRRVFVLIQTDLQRNQSTALEKRAANLSEKKPPKNS